MFQQRKPLFLTYTDVDHITESIYLGNVNAANNLTQLKRFLFKYKVVDILDSPACNLAQYFDEAVEQQQNVFNKIYLDLSKKAILKGIKFLCTGISRSSSCVIAYLMKEKGYSFHSALYQVRLKRPIVCPNVGFQKQLLDYESGLRQEISNSRIGNRSHSLATTYQLQQEKLKRQQQEEEEKKQDLTSTLKPDSPLKGIANQSLVSQQQTPLSINNIGQKPKTSSNINFFGINQRNEQIQKKSQFEIAGTSMIQSGKTPTADLLKNQAANLQQNIFPQPTSKQGLRNYSNTLPTSLQNTQKISFSSIGSGIGSEKVQQNQINSTYQQSTQAQSTSKVMMGSIGLQAKDSNSVSLQNNQLVQCQHCKTQLFKKDDILSHQPIKAQDKTTQPDKMNGQYNSNQLLNQYKGQYNNLNIKSLQNSQNNSICSEFFIPKKDWILTLEGHFGSIYCPKKECHQKIGIYSSSGLKCKCGKQINPGFLVYKDKCTNL
ncbi:dual specificity protein phosphatase 1 [Stylonychia lemnae]|uniref:protein-tyrosine-phosphatase n=1 Tax=Stylonychia lemnae TaxID=5949 RepID=A0A078A0P0_STYLE|nr:dual specificity protein phosphatase 1 [Stylonychia lemnae]|eukprot:CDW75771.1 dual specificity protein phosphatase 1 [Stylonychia lemnae]